MCLNVVSSGVRKHAERLNVFAGAASFFDLSRKTVDDWAAGLSETI